MLATDGPVEGPKLVDRLGRPYTPAMLRAPGTRPANAGLTYPAEILTSRELSRLLRAVGRGAAGERNRALVVVMWRGGLRVAEALDLEPRDVDHDAGTLTVRHGKGDRRRVVGLDPVAFAVLTGWLDTRERLDIPRGRRVFCTVMRDAAGIGRPLYSSYVRDLLKRAADRARIDRRVHPHGLRHTHAVELLREGVSVAHIQRQLGHRDLATTAVYLDHLLPAETVEVMRRRAWPAEVAA